MRLLRFLLKESWRTVLVAAVLGGLSGIASVAMVAAMVRAQENGSGSPLVMGGLFAALCVIVLLTRVGSQAIVSRLTQTTITRLRLTLSQRILEAPLRQLEEIGMPRMLNVLTGDVGTVTRTVSAVPTLVVNLVILAGGAAYLAWLSPGLLASSVAFCLVGTGSYWYATKLLQPYMRRSRETQDVVLKYIRTLVDGVKELKMHHDRRREFVRQRAQTRRNHPRQ